jgi:CheY-like chemotaxis protein
MRTNLLIVDDDEQFRTWARVLLELVGYSVAEACDGASALRAVGELDPGVVLLDVQLPDIDGFEVARRLHLEVATHEGVGAAPTVVLTSSRDVAEYGERIEKSGVAGFVHKAELSGDALARILGGGC